MLFRSEGEAAPADGEPSEPQVKQEPGDAAPSLHKKPSKRRSSNELHSYNVEELSQFRKRDLVADSEYLDVDFCTTEKLNANKPDLTVLKDYKKREEEFLRRAKDLDQITGERDAQKQSQEAASRRIHGGLQPNFFETQGDVPGRVRTPTAGANRHFASVRCG